MRPGPESSTRRRVAGGLAALAPLALLGIGQVDAQFTDTATVNKVTLTSGQVPAPVLRCSESGPVGFREVVLAWDPPAAGGPYTYRVVTQRGGTVTEHAVGGNTSWPVPGDAILPQRFTATVYAVKGGWTSVPSNATTYTVYLLDEYCT